MCMLAMVTETVKLIAMMIFDNDNSSALATVNIGGEVNIGGVYIVYSIRYTPRKIALVDAHVKVILALKPLQDQL